MVDSQLDELARAEWTPDMVMRLQEAARAAWLQSCGEIPTDHCACVTLAYRLSGRTEALCSTCRYVRATLQQARRRRWLHQ